MKRKVKNPDNLPVGRPKYRREKAVPKKKCRFCGRTFASPNGAVMRKYVQKEKALKEHCHANFVENCTPNNFGRKHMRKLVRNEIVSKKVRRK